MLEKKVIAAFLKKHGGPEVLEVGELPLPPIAPDEVRVRLRASGLNHLDIWVRRGLPHLKLAYPHILGGDGAGIVETVGPLVTQWKAGDEVIVHPGLGCRHCERCLSGWESLCPSYRILGEHQSGTNAEYVSVPAVNLFAKPPALSFEEAAGIPLVFTTAWQMLVRRAQVRPGDRVLVHAAGSGVGMAAIQIAHLFGAEVIATAGSDAKLVTARRLGAQHVINYATEDVVERVKALWPRGVDTIIDHVGRDLWAQNIRVARWGGTIVTCGATSGAQVALDLTQVFYRQLQILGSTMGSKGDFPTILRAFAEGKFQSIVDRVFPLSQIAEAHQRLEQRQQFGKIILST